MRKLIQKMRRKQAFTLVELMIVVTIVAILALIAIPLYSQQTVGAVMAEGVAGCGTIQSALRVYFAQNSTYVGATPAALVNLGYIGANDLNGNNFTQASYTIPVATATNYTVQATCNSANGLKTGAANLTYQIINTNGTITTGGTWVGAQQVQ